MSKKSVSIQKIFILYYPHRRDRKFYTKEGRSQRSKNLKKSYTIKLNNWIFQRVFSIGQILSTRGTTCPTSSFTATPLAFNVMFPRFRYTWIHLQVAVLPICLEYQSYSTSWQSPQTCPRSLAL